MHRDAEYTYIELFRGCSRTNKHDGIDFCIANLPYICSNIPNRMVFIDHNF